MSLNASSQYAVVPLRSNEKGFAGLFLSGVLGGALKMVRLEWRLRFASHKLYRTGKINVNCKLG